MATIAIIYGSVRSGREGIKAARFLKNTLEQRGHTAHLVDPIEFPLPLLDKMHKEYAAGEAPHRMQELSDLFKSADGFLIVSGEYNHSIPPALKNTLDHFQSEYFFKPSGIVTYSAGSFGGVRAAVHLRAICGELGMPSISSMFPIPAVQNAFEEDGTAIDTAYIKRADRFLTEFEWYVSAFKTQRALGTPY